MRAFSPWPSELRRDPIALSNQSCDDVPRQSITYENMSNLPSASLDTGNPRNKTALKPGRSLMDWIKLTNSSADLSGTGNRLRDISPEELAQHNKQNDAWLAIRGLKFSNRLCF